jgi:hypothetical protein
MQAKLSRLPRLNPQKPDKCQHQRMILEAISRLFFSLIFLASSLPRVHQYSHPFSYTIARHG